ncbi:MAG: SsrA-binding protein SmpB [Kiritimatiellae bacterium]|nr:SsrA-binding protein SmpB [Kiritimatiellia bacterium]
MAEKAKRERGGGTLAANRKALHDYAVLEKLETGIALVGTEVKVIRNGGVSLAGAYAQVEDGSLWLLQAKFPPYSFGNRFNHETLRPRRLLAHRREIARLQAAQEQKGLALIPLRLYLTARGRIKVEIAVCRGKAQADKRETLKRREADRDARRAIATHGHG